MSHTTTPYRLSPKGRRSLSAAAKLNQPWLHATGPKTKAGKARSARNALKHGERSAQTLQMQRAIRELLASIG